MNEIAIINNALKQPKVKDLRTEDMQGVITQKITRLFMLKGQTLNPNDLAFMGMEFMNGVYERFKGLTLGEIIHALDKGVKGDFGDYFGLSVVTFLGWIKAYNESNARSEAVKQKIEALLPQKTVPTTREAMERTKNNALLEFEYWKKGREIKGWLGCTVDIYDYLSGIGLIKLSDAEKRKAMDEAKKNVGEQIIAERCGKGKKTLFTASELIMKVVSKECMNDSKRVVMNTKRVALEWFFDKLIAEDKSLKQIING